MSDYKRTIRIKGVGTASQAPDTIILSLKLDARNNDYNKAMIISSQQMDLLKDKIVEVGFNADDLKTTRFFVDTIYDEEEIIDDGRKTWHRVFAGYKCIHNLKLEFDIDMEKLSNTIAAISKSLADPEINISFTIKDKQKFKQQILTSAAENARMQAETLCAASGVQLGELLDINYSWTEIRHSFDVAYAAPMMRECNSQDVSFNLNPDDIEDSDTVEFIWEII